MKLPLKSLAPVSENQHEVVLCLCMHSQYLQIQNIEKSKKYFIWGFSVLSARS